MRKNPKVYQTKYKDVLNNLKCTYLQRFFVYFAFETKLKFNKMFLVKKGRYLEFSERLFMQIRQQKNVFMPKKHNEMCNRARSRSTKGFLQQLDKRNHLKKQIKTFFEKMGKTTPS